MYETHTPWYRVLWGLPGLAPSEPDKCTSESDCKGCGVPRCGALGFGEVANSHKEVAAEAFLDRGDGVEGRENWNEDQRLPNISSASCKCALHFSTDQGVWTIAMVDVDVEHFT